jgi:predicted DNA binding protein/PAS domain-containing protein
VSLVPPELHVLLLGVSAATSGALAVYALYHRKEPGAQPFAALMVVVTVWTACFAAGLVTLSPRWRVFWAAGRWVGAAFVPVWFLVFALEYTGHDDVVTWRSFAALSAFPLLTVGMVWTNSYHHLIWAQQRVVVTDGIALLEVTFGPWFWAFMVYAWMLVAVAAALVVRLVFVSDYLFADQSVLLLVGVAAPVVGNVVSVFFEQPFPGIDLAPYSFTVTGVALAYALFSRRLFELVPATRRLGRNAAIGQLDDGVVIVDTDYRVIYLNAAAADLLECDPGEAMGEPVRAFVDEAALDFDAGDALADWERGDRTYSVRTSPIHDQRERLVGHTLTIQDVSERKHRERELARQRDELERVNELNAVIRGVNRALVSATSREEIERAVCERLADSDLYATAFAADVPTWSGDADRWTVAGETADPAALPAGLSEEELSLEDGEDSTVATAVDDERSGGWSLVPVVYGRTVYGALALFSRRTPATDGGTTSRRERDVLAELGELVGHAVDAVENRRLLAAEAVVELELRVDDDGDPLVRASEQTGASLAVTGVVPGGPEDLAYVAVEDADGDVVADALAAGATSVEAVGDGLLEWVVGEETLVGTLLAHGANVQSVSVADGTATAVVELPSDADVRSLVDRLQQSLPDTELLARRERDRPTERADTLPEGGVDELTDRQQEALEVAYRAGYFDWPREATAEEVADRMDISSPTFHYHLRRSEETLLAGLFDAGDTRSDATGRDNG